MTDDSKDPSSTEELMEAIRAEREERKEQVSFEWIKTVREAGELFREVGDVEAVSGEVELSVKETQEALTVYRLIFEDPPDVAIKSVDPSRAYFSLEHSLDDQYDPEEYDEPAEEILREYVGALYIDHDIDKLPVSQPPEETTPPRAIDLVDISNLFPSFELPTSALAAVASINEANEAIIESQIPHIASAISEDLMGHTVLQSVQGIQESMAALSAASMVEQAITDLKMPAAVLTDLQKVQSSMEGVDAITGSYPDPPVVPPVDDRASSMIEPDREAKGGSVSKETTEAEPEPLDTTGSVFPEAGFAEGTVDATLPDTDKVTTELTVEIPALIVQSILSSGQAYRWFSNLDKEYQTGVIGILLVYVAISTGNSSLAPIAPVAAPAVRAAIVDTSGEDE